VLASPDAGASINDTGVVLAHLSKVAIAVGLVALAVVGGGAYALASSTNVAVTVCVSHDGGTLYRAKRCARRDKQLSWNKQGPTGPQGKHGPQGIQGPQGIPGAQGIQGLQGVQGAKGDTGGVGPVGPTVGALAGGATPPGLAGTSHVIVTTTTIHLTTASSVLAVAMPTPDLQPQCPSAGCTIRLGLYLDGQPMSSSDEPLSGGANAVLGPYEPLQGLADDVAAGDHTLTLQFVDTSTGFVNATAGSATVSGVALGG
jgi:hypothetical protein